MYYMKNINFLSEFEKKTKKEKKEGMSSFFSFFVSISLWKIQVSKGFFYFK